MWDPPLQPLCLDPSVATGVYVAYLTYQNGAYPIDTHLSSLNPNNHVFLFLTWHRIGFHPKRLAQYQDFPCGITLCCNTEAELQELEEAGLDAIFCNQNAFLNPAIFNISTGSQPGNNQAPRQTYCAAATSLSNSAAAVTPSAQQRDITFIVNSNFSSFKRLHLAADVADRAHIGYHVQNSSHLHSSEIPPDHLILNPLQADGTRAFFTPQQVAYHLNRSQIGGLFSEEEGACYAATEYLLCGLPVVTTLAEAGGRSG